MYPFNHNKITVQRMSNRLEQNKKFQIDKWHFSTKITLFLDVTMSQNFNVGTVVAIDRRLQLLINNPVKKKGRAKQPCLLFW